MDHENERATSPNQILFLELFEAIERLNSKEDDLLYPKSFDELLTMPDFYKIVQHSVDKSPAEILLMILKYSIKNKLTFTAMSELMRLVNTTFSEPIMPQSKYMIEKLFNTKSDVCYHITCPKCGIYLGLLKDFKSNKCDNCEMKLNPAEPSAMNMFVILNPCQEIKDHLSKHADYYHEIMHERECEKNHIKDIYDGRCYRQFVANLPPAEKHQYVTCVFNTDGANRFKSSQYSLWPIYLMINELPPQERFNSIITCGLWFGQKPNLRIFLNPFVDMMNNDVDNYIEVQIKEEMKIVKIYPLVACVDTMARSPMQGVIQFNGKYGCNWCEHPGEYYDGSMRYPILDYHPELRNSIQTIQLMRESLTSNKPILGIKHPSPLINLNYFDIIFGFVPDYMHFYVGGVGKQFTAYAVQSLTDDQMYAIDNILLKIKVPNQLCRLTRGLSQRKMWKTLEWENWLLYYSVPIFSTIMREDKFKHWALLVESLHILLKTDITFAEIEKADLMLHDFVANVEKLYSKTALTYNVHQLLHVAQSVADWGPVWAHAAYCFETANCILLNAIKCGKGVKEQIIRFIHIQHNMNLLQDTIFQECSYTVQKYCEDVTAIRIQRSIRSKRIRYFGNELLLSSDVVDELGLTAKSFGIYSKIVKDGCVFDSCEIRNSRSCNSYARLQNNMFIKCYAFLFDEETDDDLTLCYNLETEKSKFCHNIHVLNFTRRNLVLVPTADICMICVLMNVSQIDYICELPNSLYY